MDNGTADITPHGIRVGCHLVEQLIRGCGFLQQNLLTDHIQAEAVRHVGREVATTAGSYSVAAACSTGVAIVECGA